MRMLYGKYIFYLVIECVEAPVICPGSLPERDSAAWLARSLGNMLHAEQA